MLTVLPSHAWRQTSATFSPAQLQPRAWYDAHLGGSSTQITDSSGRSVAAATFGAGSNSPLWLQYDGVPFVYFPAVASNRVTTPNTTALNITGDLTVTARLAADDWTPAATQVIASKFAASAGVQSWYWQILTAGTLQLVWVDSGGTTRTATSSVAPTGLVDGSPTWLAVTLDVDNGASGNDCRFWQSTDGVSWTQVGTTVTQAFVTSLASTTADFMIASRSAGATTPLGGKVYSVSVAAGIGASGEPGGTVAATFDAASCGQSGYTDANGTWTVIRSTTGRKTVVLSPAAGSARSVILLGTDDWVDLPAGAIVSGRTAPASVVAVVRAWATPTSAGRFYDSNNSGLALSTNGTAQQGRALYNATGANAAVHTSGLRLALLAGYDPDSTTLSVGQNSDALVTGTVAAAASDPTAARIGATTAGANVQNFELSALLTFDRVLTAGELAGIHAFYGGL